VVRALYSIIVCAIVALAVPVSQLRTVSVVSECCCPDPDNCHCPDHGKSLPSQTTIKQCHRSTDLAIGSSLPEFSPPSAVVVSPPARRVAFAEFRLCLPHPPPSPARPAAPS
jgi:hypothetical protein